MVERNWRGLRRPLVAIALGLLPFWLFLGFSNEVRVNGELVGGSRFNLGGLILAGIGLSMAVGVLRETPRWAPRLALAALAVPICLAQLAISAELVSVERLRLMLSGPPQPAPDTALSAEGRRMLLQAVRGLEQDEVALRDHLIAQARQLQALQAQHAAYAERCHGGARFAMPALPAWLSEAERAEIAAAASPPGAIPACSQDASQREMKGRVEAAMLQRERVQLVAQLREARFGHDPAPPAPAVWQLDGAPLALGERLDAVRQRLGLQGEPQPVPGLPATAPRTRWVVAHGVTADFDAAQRVVGLVLETGFAGRLGGVALGDWAARVARLHGPPTRREPPHTRNSQVYWAAGQPEVRYEIRGAQVASMQILR
ncbi:hypothetical protein ACFFMP_00180 [Pseudoroseomonas cervicalis]|uniref:hypothetical protein n=1 Tax=Teichococcus cervicalis TaxID=204525 RepID=UPI0002E9D931|nr:hypothetical protein [Pseudoroseomonas cervicalis]